MTNTKLIECPACSNSLSEAATACPKCGHPLNRRKASHTPRRWVIIGPVVIVAAIIGGYLVLRQQDSSQSLKQSAREVFALLDKEKRRFHIEIPRLESLKSSPSNLSYYP
jgi:hypothetical protein